MSVASYEGPASRKEVGDQRFLQTLALHGAAVEIPIAAEMGMVQPVRRPEQAQAVGQAVLQYAESA